MTQVWSGGASGDAAEVALAWEIRESHCRDALARALRILRKSEADAQSDRKSAPWKIATAAHLKQTTQADNRWLAEQLHMGSPVAVSQYVSQLRREGNEAAELLIEKLKT